MHKIDWRKIRSDRKLILGFLVFILAYISLFLCWAVEYFAGFRVYRPVIGLLCIIAFIDVIALASYLFGNYVVKKG